MPITTHTVTAKIADLLGAQYDQVRVTVRTNLAPGEAPIDTIDGRLLIGHGAIMVTNGTLTIPGLINPTSPGVNPSGIQYAIRIDYLDRVTRQAGSWDSGWLSVTADGNLATMVATQYAPPSWQTSFTQSMETLRDESVAARDQAKDISQIAVPDNVVKTLIQDPVSQTRSALTASFAAKPRTLSKLGRNRVVAHRGSQAIYPQNSLEGFRAAWRAGLSIETDVKMLATGELVFAHDSDCSLWSVNLTGNVEDKTAAQWATARIKPVIEGGSTACAVFVDDGLDEMVALGGSGFLEIKHTAPNPTVAAALRDMIVARGLEESVIVTSYHLSDITPSRDAGIDVGYYVSDASTPASFWTTNAIEYAGVVTTAGAAYINSLRAAGVVVMGYTYNRLHEVMYALDPAGLNCDLIGSDDAIGTSRRFPPRLADSFATRQPGPRLLKTASGKLSYLGAKPHELGLLYTDGEFASAHLGEHGIFSIPSSGFSLRWTVRFGARASDASFSKAGILIGKPSYSGAAADLLTYSNTPPGDQSAYGIQINRNGSCEVYRVNGGAAPVLVASRTSGVTAVPAGGERTIEMQALFTSTTIEVKNLTDGWTTGPNKTNDTGTALVDASPQRSSMQIGIYVKNTDAYFSNIFPDGLTAMPTP